MDDSAGRPVSIVIPAHNEGRIIHRLLTALTQQQDQVGLEITVVCNGCTDDTAEVCRQFSPLVRVIETPEPSKRLALRIGDEQARHFPRAYVDADVVVTVLDVIALVDALGVGIQAAAPARSLVQDDVSSWVRWYYDVWQALPQVRAGLFGRGVIALTDEGHQRISALPMVMSDDLAMSEVFASSERVVVEEAHAAIRPPRTLRQLVRRRTRVVTGNAQIDHLNARSAAARTTIGTLAHMVQEDWTLLPKLPVFVFVTLAATAAARRQVSAGDFDTWLRDDSSRA
jgi:glycosyltransferase involved in cell wall biosynthesis